MQRYINANVNQVRSIGLNKFSIGSFNTAPSLCSTNVRNCEKPDMSGMRRITVKINSILFRLF